MNNKVEELVEGVAETMYRQQKLDGDPRWANVGTWRKNLYRNYAKEILSRPDLYVDDSETLTDGHTTFYQVIPLAEALKEE